MHTQASISRPRRDANMLALIFLSTNHFLPRDPQQDLGELDVALSVFYHHDCVFEGAAYVQGHGKRELVFLQEEG